MQLSVTLINRTFIQIVSEFSKIICLLLNSEQIFNLFARQTIAYVFSKYAQASSVRSWQILIKKIFPFLEDLVVITALSHSGSFGKHFFCSRKKKLFTSLGRSVSIGKTVPSVLHMALGGIQDLRHSIYPVLTSWLVNNIHIFSGIEMHSQSKVSCPRVPLVNEPRHLYLVQSKNHILYMNV